MSEKPCIRSIVLYSRSDGRVIQHEVTDAEIHEYLVRLCSTLAPTFAADRLGPGESPIRLAMTRYCAVRLLLEIWATEMPEKVVAACNRVAYFAAHPEAGCPCDLCAQKQMQDTAQA